VRLAPGTAARLPSNFSDLKANLCTCLRNINTNITRLTSTDTPSPLIILFRALLRLKDHWTWHSTHPRFSAHRPRRRIVLTD
jgi:hypothetical protein